MFNSGAREQQEQILEESIQAKQEKKKKGLYFSSVLLWGISSL